MMWKMILLATVMGFGVDGSIKQNSKITMGFLNAMIGIWSLQVSARDSVEVTCARLVFREYEVFDISFEGCMYKDKAPDEKVDWRNAYKTLDILRDGALSPRFSSGDIRRKMEKIIRLGSDVFGVNGYKSLWKQIYHVLDVKEWNEYFACPSGETHYEREKVGTAGDLFNVIDYLNAQMNNGQMESDIEAKWFIRFYRKELFVLLSTKSLERAKIYFELFKMSMKNGERKLKEISSFHEKMDLFDKLVFPIWYNMFYIQVRGG